MTTCVIKDPILRFANWVAEVRQRVLHVLKGSQGERYRPELHYMRGPGPKFLAANKDSTLAMPSTADDLKKVRGSGGAPRNSEANRG